MKEKHCQQMSFTDCMVLKSINGLSACRFYSLEERKEKSCCLCACYPLFDPCY